MARGVPVASAIRRPLADRRQLISVGYPSGRYLPVTTPLDDAWSAAAAAAAALAPAEFTASYLSSLLWFCVWYTRPRCSFSLCFRCIYSFCNNASLNNLHACCSTTRKCSETLKSFPCHCVSLMPCLIFRPIDVQLFIILVIVVVK